MHSLDSSSNIPTFILKLWKLVHDEDSSELISWNRNGRSFTIKDQVRFAKELLPLYFKHSNMASFIRQLNMYGFRKVSNIEHGGLKSDDDEVEFFHHHFIKGQENQLQFIKRKMSNNSKSVTSIVKVDEFQEILSDVESIKGRQDSVDTLLNNMKLENEALWREIAILRQKHIKQQQIVEKLLQFLVSIVRNRVVGGIKRKAPLMIDSSSSNSRKILKTSQDSVCMAPSPGTSGPIIHDITDLEENDAFLPLANDPKSNSLIDPMNINFDASTLKQLDNALNVQNSVFIDQQTSDVSSNPNDTSLLAVNTIPSNILELEPETNNTLLSDSILCADKQLNSILNTPSIDYKDSIPSSSGVNKTKLIKQEDPTISNVTDLVLSKQNKANNIPTLARLTSETFNDHVEGIDAELNWLQDQLYGGDLSIDPNTLLGLLSSEPTTSDLIPKAIMDGSDNLNSKLIKSEDNSNSELFEGIDFNNITNDKDILADCVFSSDIDPSTFN